MKNKINKTKMNILQVLPELNSGGTERLVMENAKFLAEQPDVKLYIASNGGGLTYKLLQYENVKHIKLPLHTKNPLKIYNNHKLLIKLINQYDIDIVHAMSRAPAWSCYLACRKTKTKFITHISGNYHSNWFKKFYNHIMTKGDKIIVHSLYNKDYLLSENSSAQARVVKLHCGIDLNLFNLQKVTNQKKHILITKLGINLNKKIICLPGRITSIKGQNLLLHAVSHLKRDDYQLLIIGNAKKEKYINNLKLMAADLEIADKVFIKETVGDMPTLYSIVDVVVVPTLKAESFGLVAIEAQAMHKLVIANNLGGHLETVIDGQTGFLFENRNIEDLTNKINMALDLDEEKYKEITSKACQRVHNYYDIKFYNDDLLNLYRQILLNE